MDLVPEDYQQDHLFIEQEDPSKSDQLMQLLDTINKDMGSGTVFLAAQGTKKDWMMKNQHRSPRYTTNWNELPIVH